MSFKPLVIAGALALGLSTTASAQPARPLGQAFLTGVRACIANVQGKLPFNPPSKAQTDAGLVLAEVTAPDELKAFSDLSPKYRIFAGVLAKGGTVAVASDPSQHICRVVVFDAKDLTPVTAAVGPLGGDWAVVQNEPQQDFTVFTGTVLGSPKLTIRTRKPPANSAYGTAQYMLTLLPLKP